MIGSRVHGRGLRIRCVRVGRSTKGPGGRQRGESSQGRTVKGSGPRGCDVGEGCLGSSRERLPLAFSDDVSLGCLAIIKYPVPLER